MIKEETNDFTGAEYAQPLFDLIEEMFGKPLLESELSDIAAACQPFYQPAIERLRKQNAELAEALRLVWRDCEASVNNPESYDAIRQKTFAAIRSALANNQPENPADLDEV